MSKKVLSYYIYIRLVVSVWPKPKKPYIFHRRYTSMSVNIPRCPSCNASLSQNMSVCEYCDSPVVISSFSSLAGMSAPKVNKYANAYKDMMDENPDSEALAISLGMCFMKLKLYDTDKVNDRLIELFGE